MDLWADLLQESEMEVTCLKYYKISSFVCQLFQYRNTLTLSCTMP